MGAVARGLRYQDGVLPKNVYNKRCYRNHSYKVAKQSRFVTTELAASVDLEGQELVAGGHIGCGLGQLLVELLPAEVLVGLAVGVGQGGHVEEVVGLEGVVVGREGAAVNTR